VYYWAYKNNIPVFCPAITGEYIFERNHKDMKYVMIDVIILSSIYKYIDGSIGDLLYFHSYK